MWVPVERKGCGVRVDVGIDPYKVYGRPHGML